MLIYRVTDDDIFMAAIATRLRVDDLRRDGRGWRFKLRPQPGETRRRSILHPERKVHAVCWHQFGRFMRAILDRTPDAVIRTGVTSYNGVADFNLRADATGDENVGNAYVYVARREACTCEGEDYDKANDWIAPEPAA